jgi:hypothetical protein
MSSGILTIPETRIEKLITRYKKGIFPYMELDEKQVEKILNAEFQI